MSTADEQAKTLAALGILAAVPMIVFLACMLGAAFGAITGWVSALMFPATFAKVTAFTGLQPYQFGALAGFLGGFFRPAVFGKKT